MMTVLSTLRRRESIETETTSSDWAVEWVEKDQRSWSQTILFVIVGHMSISNS
jgi:hypothetical protein